MPEQRLAIWACGLKRHRLDHSQKAPAHLVVGNGVKKSDQVDRLRAVPSLAEPPFLWAEGCVRRCELGEEIRDGYAKDVGDGRKTRSADAIGPTLVFLHLLEGQAERVGEAFLVKAEEEPPRGCACPHGRQSGGERRCRRRRFRWGAALAAAVLIGATWIDPMMIL